jgi:hypothetical protein
MLLHMEKHGENCVSNHAERCEKCRRTRKDKETKFKHCSRCKSIIYCSVECQRDDWKEHKEKCKTDAEISTEHGPCIKRLTVNEHRRMCNNVADAFSNIEIEYDKWRQSLFVLAKSKRSGWKEFLREMSPVKDMNYLCLTETKNVSEISIVSKLYTINDSNFPITTLESCLKYNSCTTFDEAVLVDASQIGHRLSDGSGGYVKFEDYKLKGEFVRMIPLDVIYKRYKHTSSAAFFIETTHDIYGYCHMSMFEQFSTL